MSHPSRPQLPPAARRRSLPQRFAAGLAAAALCIAPTAGAAFQRGLTDIPSVDPEVERKALDVCEGFEVNLYAADPLLAKPIQINFDSAGRLWAATSSVYPQIKPGEPANDRVVVLEDKDGDGRADSTTVFAEGLLIPTGIEPGYGGCFVANSTELLHLADTDGDGKADVRRTVLSGFGTEDTHHIIHTFRWGHDGALYFNQSVYIHSHVETPHGVRRLGAGGIWQFRPDDQRLEVLCRGMWNTWGHHFDRYGQSFATDGAGSQGIHYVIPGATYAAVPNVRREFKGLNDNHPKYSGAEIVDGRHLPDDWQGSIVTHDFRGNRVCRFKIEEDGAGYRVKQMPDVIKTRFVAFRPIDVKLGPDGALYVADWYNPIIQHGEVDFRDPRRDHVHGRIWRITAKNRPLVPRTNLPAASTKQLVSQLAAPESWTRHFARRELVDRLALAADKKDAVRKESLQELAAWSGALAKDDPQAETLRMEALWTTQALGATDKDLLRKTLTASDGRIRAAGVRTLSAAGSDVPQIDAWLAEAVGDEHPRVRLEAVRALGTRPSVESVQQALRVLDRQPDRFTEYALWLTVNDLAPVWTPALKEGKTDLGGQVHHLEYALTAAASPEVLPALVKMLAKPELSPAQRRKLLELLAALGGPAELEFVLQQTLSATDPEAQASLLSKLTLAAQQRKARPRGDLARTAKLVAEGAPAVRREAIRLAAQWRLAEALAPLQTLAGDAKQPADLRQESLAALARFGADGKKFLEAKLADPADPKLRVGAAKALLSVDPAGAAPAAVGLLQQSGDDLGSANELLLALVQHKEGPAALQKALEGAKLPPDVAKLGARLARANLKDAAALEAALRAAGGLGAAAKPLTDDERRALVEQVLAKGNAARGESIFRRNELACVKCHAIGGAGGQVGPDLASIGAAAQLDYLVDSIFDPNKAIKENYHSVVVNTVDGKALAGIKVRENKQVVVLRDAEDREVSVPVDEIEEQAAGKSLMPTGLVDSLTRQELYDLVRFLSELGKNGPFAVDRGPIARVWQTLENTHDARVLSLPILVSPASKTDERLSWTRRYTLVSGGLPVHELPGIGAGAVAEGGTARMARAQLEATTEGTLRIAVDSPEGLTAWLDGQPLAAQGKVFTAKVAPGPHTVVFRIDAARGAPLRATLEEGDGAARAAWANGK